MTWSLLQLPASFFAYRKQQHRWTCGPVQLWFKASKDIWASRLPMHRKLELILLYFGVRKFATHWVSLGFFCTLVPLSIFTPEVRLSDSLWARTGHVFMSLCFGRHMPSLLVSCSKLALPAVRSQPYGNTVCCEVIISGTAEQGLVPDQQVQQGLNVGYAQVSIPLWALVHLPVVVTLTTAIFTPRVRPVLSMALLTAADTAFAAFSA